MRFTFGKPSESSNAPKKDNSGIASRNSSFPYVPPGPLALIAASAMGGGVALIIAFIHSELSIILSTYYVVYRHIRQNNTNIIITLCS